VSVSVSVVQRMTFMTFDKSYALREQC